MCISDPFISQSCTSDWVLMNDAKIPWQEAKKRIKKSKDVDYKQLHKIAQKFLNDCGLIVSELIFCLFVSIID